MSLKDDLETLMGIDVGKPDLVGDNCIGIFYRCRTSFYRNVKREFHQRVKMIPLKTYSCSGRCRENTRKLCDDDWLDEDLSAVGIEDWNVRMPNDPMDGGLYQLRCVIIDDEEWYWEFVHLTSEEYSKLKYEFEIKHGCV